MRGLNRRIATIALLGVAINVIPTEGWLRGKAEPGNGEHQEQRRAQIVRSESVPTIAPTMLPTESPSVAPVSPATAAPVSPTTDAPLTSTSTPTTAPTDYTGSPTPGGTTNEPTTSSTTASPTISPTTKATTGNPTTSPTLATTSPTTSPTLTAASPTAPTTTSSPTAVSSESIAVSSESVAVSRESIAAGGGSAEVESQYTGDGEVTYEMQPEQPEETNMEEEAEDEDVPKTTADPTQSPLPPTPDPSPSPTPEPTPDPTPSPTTSSPTVGATATLAADAGSQNTMNTEPETEQEKEEEEDPKSGFRQTYYEGDAWDFLPMNAKAAAMTLGWDQTAWDFGQEVYSDSLLWEQLNTEQVMAATILGYDENNWNEKHVPASNGNVVPGIPHSGGGFASAWTASVDDTTSAAEDQGSQTATETDATPAAAADSGGGSSPIAGQEVTVTAPQDNIAPTTQAAQANPNYMEYSWTDLPAVQKTAAQQLGYDEKSWDNDEVVLTSFLHWNQMTFDLRQAAKTLGLRQQTWNMSVEKRDPPEGASTHSSLFYSSAAPPELKNEAEDNGSAVVAVESEQGGMKQKQNVALNLEPQITEMENNIGALQRQLDNAMGMIKAQEKKMKVQEERMQAHDQVLKVLQGLDPSTTIGSVADIIQLGKKKWGGQKKKNRNQDPMQPAAPINVIDSKTGNVEKRNGNKWKRQEKKKTKKKKKVYEPETRKRTFWAGEDENDTNGSNKQVITTGYDPATGTVGAGSIPAESGTIFGVGVP